MSAAATISNAMNSESLRRQTGSHIRWRAAAPPPLDLSAAEDVAPTPARSEKVGRRESRLGLRSIFGRNKTPRQPDDPGSPIRTKPLGRENATEGIPYYTLPPGKPTVRTQISRPLSTAIEDPEFQLEDAQPLADTPKRKTGNGQAKSGRAGSSSWNVPPLHKAYPHAVRYSTLPAATVPADLILRAHEKKSGEPAPLPDADPAQAEEKGKSRRRHRRSKSGAGLDLEWTTKTYILVTSGYLLEYASEGPFDRLPEKVLRLGRYSAAFASDLIPGRHWVLQVASATGSDAGAAVDQPNRSFFSRLPFRGSAEKRSASNMLLVFESADMMDEWMATLRRAIEALGGKKSLSETGVPKDEHAVPLREQHSQRTLVVRNADRYSRSIPEDQPWEPDLVRRESDTSFAPSETGRDQSIDDMSATNSVISHDGQQLDSLRSSANRLSCISSGQRTMITSAGSSPACSPTVESFSTPSEEPPRRHVDAALRANASAIADRRKSLQTMSPFVELRPATNAGVQRPHSGLIHLPAAPAGEPEPSTGNTLSPNFSVPYSSNRRYSSARLTMTDSPPLSSTPPNEPEAPSRSLARKPPTALRVSRPLSMVMDQPSPRENVPERPATRHGGTPSPTDPEFVPLPPSRPESGVLAADSVSPGLPTQSSPRAPSSPTSPRRLASMGALRPSEDTSFGVPSAATDAPRLRELEPAKPRERDSARCHSSIDMYGHGNALSSPSRMAKRASMLPFVPDRPPPNPPIIHDPPSAPPPSIPLPPVPTSSDSHLKPADVNGHALMNRRSMPHLVEGPPPAPPPTCALPPIPKKAAKQNDI
ncbi:hypothetical protein ACRE_013870 [Hapsidospora chrysogenum ATCC 11550]|uniref:PH domain-containing protein n=1 Tax=Hapsidospora chrysogenum (strain ATCC 11550 / CBS 779.69 / DSM 880 / IAM 14645 / JCM 23072 / IMI 49137) TaxID=857340 RepID=A0A086TEG8_HAPC1|nr:hypothetical protein ACRE_013870 [Hapsidospora chrysogenum ATCC 11550]